jgi:hypothetical protein
MDIKNNQIILNPSLAQHPDIKQITNQIVCLSELYLLDIPHNEQTCMGSFFKTDAPMKTFLDNIAGLINQLNYLNYHITHPVHASKFNMLLKHRPTLQSNVRLPQGIEATIDVIERLMKHKDPNSFELATTLFFSIPNTFWIKNTKALKNIFLKLVLEVYQYESGLDFFSGCIQNFSSLNERNNALEWVKISTEFCIGFFKTVILDKILNKTFEFPIQISQKRLFELLAFMPLCLKAGSFDCTHKEFSFIFEAQFKFIVCAVNHYKDQETKLKIHTLLLSFIQNAFEREEAKSTIEDLYKLSAPMKEDNRTNIKSCNEGKKGSCGQKEVKSPQHWVLLHKKINLHINELFIPEDSFLQQNFNIFSILIIYGFFKVYKVHYPKLLRFIIKQIKNLDMNTYPKDEKLNLINILSQFIDNYPVINSSDQQIKNSLQKELKEVIT